MSCAYSKPNGSWSVSLLNGYFIGNIPYFQTQPYGFEMFINVSDDKLFIEIHPVIYPAPLGIQSRKIKHVPIHRHVQDIQDA